MSEPTQSQPNNPLHGVKLADIVEALVERFGWEELGNQVRIRCFNHDPSIKSSLKFLRKTPWAREKVEQLYLKTHDKPKVKFVVTKTKKT
jgi:uncharacterized protein (DUF2132 family)